MSLDTSYTDLVIDLELQLAAAQRLAAALHSRSAVALADAESRNAVAGSEVRATLASIGAAIRAALARCETNGGRC